MVGWLWLWIGCRQLLRSKWEHPGNTRTCDLNGLEFRPFPSVDVKVVCFFHSICEGACTEHILYLNVWKCGGGVEYTNEISKTETETRETLIVWGFFSFCSIHYRTLLPRSTEAHSASPPSQIKQWGVIETWQKKRESDCRGEVTFARSNAETAATNGEFRVNTHEALRVIPSFIPIFSSWGANYAIMIEQRAKWLCLR